MDHVLVHMGHPDTNPAYLAVDRFGWTWLTTTTVRPVLDKQRRWTFDSSEVTATASDAGFKTTQIEVDLPNVDRSTTFRPAPSSTANGKTMTWDDLATGDRIHLSVRLRPTDRTFGIGQSILLVLAVALLGIAVDTTRQRRRLDRRKIARRIAVVIIGTIVLVIAAPIIAVRGADGFFMLHPDAAPHKTGIEWTPFVIALLAGLWASLIFSAQQIRATTKRRLFGHLPQPPPPAPTSFAGPAR